MNAQPQDMQVIFTRIEALERQNRKLKQITVAGLLLLTTVVLMGVTRPTRTIEAQRFVLTDSAGRTRAALGFENEDAKLTKPALTMYDSNGKPRLLLSVTSKSDGSAFSELRMLREGAEGRPQWPAVELYGGSRGAALGLDAGKGGIDLGILPNGSAGLSLRGPEVGSGVDLGWSLTEPVGPHLALHDSQGFEATLGVTTLKDIKAAGTTRTSAASLIMFGKGGKVLWSAP